jgi:hypothetical protein
MPRLPKMALRRVSHCTQSPRRLQRDSTLLCQTCLKTHVVDWQPGWKDRMHDFIDLHYEDHGRFAFAIVAQ